MLLGRELNAFFALEPHRFHSRQSLPVPNRGRRSSRLTAEISRQMDEGERQQAQKHVEKMIRAGEKSAENANSAAKFLSL